MRITGIRGGGPLHGCALNSAGLAGRVGATCACLRARKISLEFRCGLIINARSAFASILLALLFALGLALTLPRPAAAIEWQNYLEDDFETPESMFYTGQAGEAQYSIDEEGHYIIDGLESGSDSLSALTDSMYYYYVQSECQVLESTAGDLAFCGIVFHYHKLGDGRLAYYVFYTYGDGYYGAKRVIGTDVEILLPLKKTDLFNPDGYSNTLAVDAQGTRFNLYINGDYVDGFTDMQVDGGGFGFYVSKNSRGSFDNFKVKTEKRGGSKRGEDEPSVADDEEGGGEEPGRPARGYFGGYEPPQIPKDPDRPLYPWEVGYDKSYRKKVQDAKEREAEDEVSPDDSDYIPDDSPIQPVPEDEAGSEEGPKDNGAKDSDSKDNGGKGKDDKPRRSAKPEKKPAGEDEDEAPRTARPDRSKVKDPESGDADPDAAPSGRKAKGGKLQPTDGFRETGGPAPPAEAVRESERQVRPPLKGDKAPALRDEEDADADDGGTETDDDAESLGVPDDAGSEPGESNEPELSRPEPPADSSGQMVRPEPGAGSDEGAGDESAGDMDKAGSGNGASDADAEGAAEESNTQVERSVSDSADGSPENSAGMDEQSAADESGENASGAEGGSSQEMELKPQLPSKGKPKGKGKGKTKGKPKGKSKDKPAGKKPSKEQAESAADSAEATADEGSGKDGGNDGGKELPADTAADKQSSRRHGIKTGGDDWEVSSSRPRTVSEPKKDKTARSKDAEDVAGGAESGGSDSGNADEAEGAGTNSAAQSEGFEQAARPPAEGSDAGAPPSDDAAASEGEQAGLDGFSDQQADGLGAAGMDHEAGDSADMGADSSAETVMDAAHDSALESAEAVAEEQMDSAGLQPSDEAALDGPNEARPPAREVPGEQPELESGALKHSLLLDYVNVSTVQDDFSQQRWPIADNDTSAYRYSDGAYELDNLAAQTMAISYQQDSFVDSELSCDVRFLGGETAVGFGLAGRFRVEDGAVSYYALFVSSSGEVLLLKVLRGEEIVLSDWQPCPALRQGEANRLSLELVGNTLRASVNGELAAEAEDSDISGGGYALLAGPGVAASYDDLLLRGVRAQ